MNNYKTEVLLKEQVSKDIFLVSFKCSLLAQAAKPGQFIEVLCKGHGAPFLRRPFGIHRVDKEKGSVEFLFKRLGRGTEILSFLERGNILDVTGPLGKGFEIRENKAAFIAGGGMGIAPLLFLAESLSEKGQKVKIFLAARNARDIARADIFQQFGELIISTEDGSLGEKCLIDTPLERALKEDKNAVIYACGPHGMLRCIAGLAAKYNVEAQVSLEEKMACGMGVCRGCPVEVKNKDTKYKMVCKDGPVFKAEDIIW